MGLANFIVKQLKSILKARSITYSDLAVGIGLSEAALKRAFAEHAFSLKRLEEICDFLDIDLAMLTNNGMESSEVCVLTVEQEELLASDEKLLTIYYLCASRMTALKIKKYFNFSDRDISKCLSLLDKVKIIELNAENNYRLLVEQDYCWPETGPLKDLYCDVNKQAFMDSSFKGENELQRTISGQVAPSSLQVIDRKIRQLEGEIRELMKLDRNYYKGKKLNIAFVSSYRPWTIPLVKKYMREKK